MDWREVLKATPDCIDVQRFADELTGAEREHLASCVHCQTELALFREMMSEEMTEDSQWIAEQLRRRNNVVAFRPKAWRVLYAVAAALAVVIGISWWQFREPSIDVPLTGTDTYRSARLELIAPIGDIARAPNELRWRSVPNASRYHVRIMEVDATEVWSGDTNEPHVALPPAVIAQFRPGKSLLWEVQAFRGNAVLATSETQNVRVTP